MVLSCLVFDSAIYIVLPFWGIRQPHQVCQTATPDILFSMIWAIAFRHNLSKPGNMQHVKKWWPLRLVLAYGSASFITLLPLLSLPT